MKKFLLSLLCILPSTLWAGTHVMQNDPGITIGSITVPTALMGNSTDTALGSNPWVMINSSGTSQALTVTDNGYPSGGVQNELGVVNIKRLLGSSPAASLVLVDSVTDTQAGAGVFEIWSDNPLHNDPLIWIHRTSSNSSPEMRWDSPSPNLEIVNTSTDTTLGYGKWEPFAEASHGVDLQINNRAYSNGTFETLAFWHPLSKLDLMPGLYLNAQNTTDDGGALVSSDTTGMFFQTLNAHTVGITAPQSSQFSWIMGLPILPKANGVLLYNAGNRGGNFSVRQSTWTDTDFTYATTTGVKVSSLTLTGQITFPGQTTDCSGTSNALTWASGTGKVGCNTITGGGGGSSSLAVGTGTASNFTNNITSPTAAISFLGSQFGSIAIGTTNFITINTSSFTALGPSPNLSNLSGTLQASQEPAHTGDVTNSAGSLAMTAAGTQPNITNFSGSITHTSSVTVNATLQVSTLTVTSGFYITKNTLVNANYVASSTDTVILASATPAGITITMPPATATGHNLTIVKVDLDSYTVTINGNGSDVMQGTGTLTLNGFRQTDQVQDTDTGNWSPWGHGIETTPMQIAALGNNGNAGAASAISTSSDTYIYATRVDVPICVNNISVNVGTANGGMDLGIYDANGLLMTHTGTTAIPGTNLQTLTLTPTFCMPAGSYYVGVYCNSITATFLKMTAGATHGSRRYTSAGGSSLPSSVSLSGGVSTAVGIYTVLGVAGGTTF